MNPQFLLSCQIIKNNLTPLNKYPFNLPLLKHLNEVNFHKNVTFLIGENGSGKSTLLEAIAINYGFNPEGGSKNFNFSTQNTHSDLANHIKLVKGIKRPEDGYFLRAESFYNLASNIDDIKKEDPRILTSYGGKSLHQQSHGESFLTLFNKRFFGNGLYILDEPEAALSPQRQLEFLVRMNELINQNSQFIIATHSPIILSYPKAKILQISQTEIKEISYEETEYYTLYKSFLNNYKKILDQLNFT